MFKEDDFISLAVGCFAMSVNRSVQTVSAPSEELPISMRHSLLTFNRRMLTSGLESPTLEEYFVMY